MYLSASACVCSRAATKARLSSAVFQLSAQNHYMFLPLCPLEQRRVVSSVQPAPAPERAANAGICPLDAFA